MSNRRFEMHQYRQILARMRLGETDRSISRAGLMGRKKAGQIREIAEVEGWLNPETPLPEEAVLAAAFTRKAEEPTQSSLILPYAQDIQRWHQQGVQGTTIHEALVRDYGFIGSYSAVRRFIQRLPDHQPRASVILDFEPGEAAQVDFGTGPRIIDVYTGQVIPTWFFVMTLAWSRHQYAEIVTNQKIETWLGCHRRAFEFFGGVPSKAIIDSTKCAITKACFYDPVTHRSYADTAEAYGFLISPCPPGDPKKKGIVEAGVKYLKRRFMPLRDIRTVPDGNRQLLEWILGTAGNRIHGTTHQRPLDLFATERLLLQPLPANPPELGFWAKLKLHGNCHVQFEKAFYSAPYRLVHRELWLRAAEKTVKIYRDLDLVAIHPRLRRPGQRSTIPEHLPPDALAYKMQDPQWCLKEAAAVGPCCLTLMETLFADRVLDHLRAAQGIIGFRKRYGDLRLERACQRAIAFETPQYGTVKQILKKGLDQLPQTDQAFDILSQTYTGQGRFCRHAGSLLAH
jgi:transposase